MNKTMLAIAASVAIASSANAGPIGVDGIIGAEWGAPTATVSYDPGAPTSNFAAPGPTNHITAYSIYMRTDGSYLYGAVAASGSTAGVDFANIYYDINNVPGSDFGIEVTNDRFFFPGLAPYYNDTLNLSTFAVGTGVIEFAIDWSVFTADAYGILGSLTVPAGGKVTTRLSQSFGYSVAGGPSYGVDRLGSVNAPSAVPEPSALMLLMSLGLLTLGLVRFRRGSHNG